MKALPQRILMTGAAGRIGVVLRERFRGRYSLLRLLDVAPQEPAGRGEEVITADLADMSALQAASQGIDCVVHMAGIPTEAPWERILQVNIAGCYNVFEAARVAGIKRVVFASSNHVVGFHRRERHLDASSELRPDSRYGVSKVFGEALGRMYADKHGMSVACLRIGPFRVPDRPAAARELMNWISHGDMARLVARCIEHPHYHFAVIYGVSNNHRNSWSNVKVDYLGYEPQDDAERFSDEVLAASPTEDPVAVQFHGGRYCSGEFSGDTQRID